MQLKPILPNLLLIITIVVVVVILIILYRSAINTNVIQAFEISQAPFNANSESSNTTSQKALDIILSPFFIIPLVISTPLVIFSIWACYKKWTAFISARNQLADSFRGIMTTLSPFRLFQLVANAFNLTHGHLMDWLFTTRPDALFPWTATTITNSANAFIEWLLSQLNPLLQWTADIVNSPTFRDVMESLPSFRLTALRSLQWAAGLGDDRPVTGATEAV